MPIPIEAWKEGTKVQWTIYIGIQDATQTHQQCHAGPSRWNALAWAWPHGWPAIPCRSRAGGGTRSRTRDGDERTGRMHVRMRCRTVLLETHRSFSPAGGRRRRCTTCRPAAAVHIWGSLGTAARPPNTLRHVYIALAANASK